MTKQRLLSILILGLLPLGGFAQEAQKGFLETYYVEIAITLALTVCVLTLIALIVALQAVRALIRHKQGITEEEQSASVMGFTTIWSKINDLKPIEKESDILTDHEYDGIRELDNNLPPWWTWMFYATIVFGVVYLLNYHVLGTGELQEQEYISEMTAAEEQVAAYQATQANNVDENSVTFLESETALASGGEIFAQYCVACHGAEGQGGVGPNLTDEFWIHGGSMSDIFKTIKYGVPQKGMIAWSNQLTPVQMQEVSSYIYTMFGTTPPNPKEPQGDKYDRVEAEESSEPEIALNE
ncbi:MAG: c-type cytochrome [Cyclobacteriaceae bacterium]|nr:c-type cytochrome [Cyclobacteriaceae bacterium HetDA_MAG_MS6]